jgi:hypothetical protein
MGDLAEGAHEGCLYMTGLVAAVPPPELWP